MTRLHASHKRCTDAVSFFLSSLSWTCKVSFSRSTLWSGFPHLLSWACCYTFTLCMYVSVKTFLSGHIFSSLFYRYIFLPLAFPSTTCSLSSLTSPSTRSSTEWFSTLGIFRASLDFTSDSCLQFRAGVLTPVGSDAFSCKTSPGFRGPLVTTSDGQSTHVPFGHYFFFVPFLGGRPFLVPYVPLPYGIVIILLLVRLGLPTFVQQPLSLMGNCVRYARA